MKLSEAFIALIERQEVLDAHRTRLLLQLQSSNVSEEIQWYRLVSLQIILAEQDSVASALLRECATLTCENVEWPVEIRA